jgi:hypothetical protein
MGDKVINIRYQTLIFVGIVVSILGLILAYKQFKEQKELNAIQKQINLHELDQIKHNQG